MEAIVGTQSLAWAVTYNAVNDNSQCRRTPILYLTQECSLGGAYVEVSYLCGTETRGSGTHPGPNKNENALRVQRHSPC